MNLYKICLLGVVVLYNTACDGYYGNDKNPFKTSGQCDNEIYSYSKLDLASEDFGKIGVVSNIKEYPRAGVNKVFTYNDNKILSIEGKFASLCKSSIINKVKMELRNDRGELKTYYPDISSGYRGDISKEIDVHKNQENRCFFKDTKINIKTWARDEDGNTYYANKYTSSPDINVKSDISWNAGYQYQYRNEYRNKETNTSIKYKIEYKYEDREIDDVNWTYKYKYTYKYRYEYEYGDKYRYKYPIELSINADNTYKGKYYAMNVNISFIETSNPYPIDDDYRKVYFSLSGNSKMKSGERYNIKVSLMEELKNCNIRSKIITKSVYIPNESIDDISYSVLIDTKKVLLDTRKNYVSRVRKD